MDKEKQIEDIRKDIFAAFGGYAKWEEDWKSLAEAVYNAGYRKASEVVEEVIVQIENTLNKIIEKCESNGCIEGCAIAKVIQLRLSTELKKKYTGEGKCG